MKSFVEYSYKDLTFTQIVRIMICKEKING